MSADEDGSILVQRGPDYFRLFFGVVLLLFPGCAFYGAWFNFEVRGNVGLGIACIVAGLLLLVWFAFICCAEYNFLSITNERFQLRRPLFRYLGQKNKTEIVIEWKAVKELRIRELNLRKQGRTYTWTFTGQNKERLFRFSYPAGNFNEGFAAFFKKHKITTRLVLE